MKNLLTIFMAIVSFFTSYTNQTYAQTYNATGNVIAVLSFGLQDVAYITNEENGDLYKTVLLRIAKKERIKLMYSFIELTSPY